MTWYRCGQAANLIQAHRVLSKPNGSEPVSGYGNNAPQEGVHQWKVKIGGKCNANVVIGVCDWNDQSFKDSFFYNHSGHIAYAYYHTYGLVSHDGYNSSYHPKSFQAGDIITVHLDLIQKTVAFSKNDMFLGVAFRNIRVMPYRLAVTLWSNSTVEILEFKRASTKSIQNNDDQKSQETIKDFPKIIQELQQKLKKANETITELKSKMDEQKQLETENKALKEEVIKLRMKCMDIRLYRQWSTEQIISWIMSLENGRFKQYENSLRTKLTAEQIKGQDLDDVNGLVIKQWGVKDAKDKKVLLSYVESLRSSVPTHYQ
eukprot:320862_1